MSRLKRWYPPANSTSSIRSNLQDTSSSSEDEKEDWMSEEQEQERLLSEQHGEAFEAPSSTSKKRRIVNERETDADIVKKLNSNETSKVKERRPRLTITEKEILGPKGIISIHKGPRFRKMKYRHPITKNIKDKNKRIEMEVVAAAAYTTNLMGAYESFATNLMPIWNHTDTLQKIQDLGGKKQIRNYIQNMREEVCKDHLVGIFGKEKTERLMHELEHGLKVHRDKQIQLDKEGCTKSERLKDLELEGKDDEDSHQQTKFVSITTKQVEKKIESENAGNIQNEDEGEIEATFEEDWTDNTKTIERIQSNKNDPKKCNLSNANYKRTDSIIANIEDSAKDIIGRENNDQEMESSFEDVEETSGTRVLEG